MLVSHRKASESLILRLPDGREIEVLVCEIRGTRVKLAVEAPLDVGIRRKETGPWRGRQAKPPVSES